MLLALSGRMPEALVAMSNAIDLAKHMPTDDPLALARAYDAIGRTLLEMRRANEAVVSLCNALDEFTRQGRQSSREALETKMLIQRASKSETQ